MPNQEKNAEWVQKYLKYVDDISIAVHVKKEEGYKFAAVDNFQRNFDIEAVDLSGMLEKAIPSSNLVATAHFWPLRMLLSYAQLFPDETRTVLRKLFDESIDVGKRITYTVNAFERINEQRDKQLGRPAKTFIGLRFLSLLLSFRFPNDYNAIKPTEWKVFCDFINPDFVIRIHTSPGDQYHLYEPYIEDLRTYLKERKEIKAIKDELTKGLAFQDEEYRWITQDVIYVTARVFANEYSNKTLLPGENESEIEEPEMPSDSEEDFESNTGFMPLEQYLENYMVKNWDLIDFGENLTMYRDEDGAPCTQYATDVGVIDILAKDAENNFVVIELKRAESGNNAVGQVLKYMGWVAEKLASHGQKVRGMIIVGKAEDTLKSAVSPVANIVVLKEYRMKMKLEEPKPLYDHHK